MNKNLGKQNAMVNHFGGVIEHFKMELNIKC